MLQQFHQRQMTRGTLLEDQVNPATEVLWQGREVVWQGREVVWQGREVVWQGREVVWQGRGDVAR